MEAFPSPPRGGWSTGFITTPLTMGHLPSQHLDPALPKLFWFTPTLPTCPTVAKQFWDTKRTSQMVILNFAIAPAALANCQPLPSVIYMLCMVVPKCISIEGRFRFCACFKQFFLLHITISLEAFPIDIVTFVPETIVYPTIAPLRCKIYLFSPSP
ncbi:hypothetical protein ZWY2020_046515 [Hordeum vulgare]|nr:hypothetical protein ZWY2020_046515 [Hordeum vulgare]